MTKPDEKPTAPTVPAPTDDAAAEPKPGPKSGPKPAPKEFGGPTGPEPTRYGDWERNGRVSDF